MDFCSARRQQSTTSGDAAAISENNPNIMKKGDVVIVYLGHDSLDYITLKQDGVYDNKFGAFHHNEFIGKLFGSKIHSKTSSGWIYALLPNPELWSIAQHSRTQIVNSLDANVIALHLDLFPGCKVVESGTGSGAMTLTLARAVSPNGHVYTYEYNQLRANAVKEEFEMYSEIHNAT